MGAHPEPPKSNACNDPLLVDLMVDSDDDRKLPAKKNVNKTSTRTAKAEPREIFEVDSDSDDELPDSVVVQMPAFKVRP